MPKTKPRTYSRYTKEVLSLLSQLIRIARKEAHLSAKEEVAERASISRGLLQRIEKGDAKCEIGAAFEVALRGEFPVSKSSRTQQSSLRVGVW